MTTHIDLSTGSKMKAAHDAIEAASAKRLKPRFEDGATYAEMLMSKYPERVLRFLETMTDDELQAKCGSASEDEVAANYHRWMLEQTAKHGSK